MTTFQKFARVLKPSKAFSPAFPPVPQPSSSRKAGKENHFRTTKKGQDACDAYRKVRESCLIRVLKPYGLANSDIGEMAGLMRALSGLYDQAARAAASL